MSAFIKKFKNKILFIFIFFSAFAAAESFTKKIIKINNHSLSFQMPSSWQYVEGYQGRDVTILGPMKSGRRNVIIIEKAKSDDFSLAKEAIAIDNYKKVKQDWIKRHKGILVSTDLGKKLKFLKTKHIYNETTYKIDKNTFVEGDLFMTCSKDHFTNISFLILKSTESEFNKIWLAVLKSIKC